MGSNTTPSAMDRRATFIFASSLANALSRNGVLQHISINFDFVDPSFDGYQDGAHFFCEPYEAELKIMLRPFEQLRNLGEDPAKINIRQRKNNSPVEKRKPGCIFFREIEDTDYIMQDYEISEDGMLNSEETREFNNERDNCDGKCIVRDELSEQLYAIGALLYSDKKVA